MRLYDIIRLGAFCVIRPMEGMIIMTHEERRIWLIKKLLSERIEYRKYQIPDYEKGQKDMLRSLMNVRMPQFISDEFLQVQDEYLQVENAKAGELA